MDTNIWRFQSCCVGGSGAKTPFFAVEEIAAADSGNPNALFCVYFQSTWYSYQTTPAWSAIAMAAAKYPSDPSVVVLALSETGMTWQLRPKEQTESTSRVGSERGFTNLATVGEAIYACGMGRLLMRRDANGQWHDIRAPRPSLDEGVVGFTALAGLSETLVYAVGWKGEIWVRSDDVWDREDTPSNANLNALSIAPDGTVYAVGDDGVMLKGQQGYWEVIETDTDFNLQDVCVHEGTVYACSDFEVLQLTDGGLMPAFGEDADDSPGTCLKLVSAGAQGLYSIGPFDVFVLLDGSWRRLA